MDSDQVCRIFGDYADAFGEDHAEELLAPNLIGDIRFIEALAQAVRAGRPLTMEEVTARFGAPFRDFIE